MVGTLRFAHPTICTLRHTAISCADAAAARFGFLSLAGGSS
jgi:hypothetical protein